MSPVLGIIASGISGHLTPPYDPSSYYALASVTVGSGGASYVEFNGIPNTYKHLQIRQRTISATGSQAMQVGNGTIDTGANYAFHFLYGEGANAGAGNSLSETKAYLGYSVGASYPHVAVTDILDYTSSKNKVFRSLNGQDYNGTAAYVMLSSSVWLNTGSITSIRIKNESANLNEFSTFALYGVK